MNNCEDQITEMSILPVTQDKIEESTNGKIPEESIEDEQAINSNEPETEKLFYQINDVPPWYLTILLGFQHFLTMAGATISVPFILCPLMCMADDDPGRTYIISTILFVSGLVTLLQSTFGSRLPIIQGGSFSFIVPTIAILNLPKWKCPPDEILDQMTFDERTEFWQQRMREIQGAILFAGVFEAFIGFFGIIGIILKFITPMTIAPAIAMIGLSLFKVAALHASSNWLISGITIVLIALFSQYLKNFKIPIPFTSSIKRSGLKRYPIFQVFPVLLSIGISWLLCFILTSTEAISKSNPARTDSRMIIINNSPWFRFPYPFQWGPISVTAGAIFGMIAAILASTVESIGDYYAAARISGASKPPIHAMNRGIFCEGIGCILAGMFGTANGTTSYSENIGAISVTKVGSRRVIQSAGITMIFCALIGKFGAIFLSIPEPIVGGVFCVVFGTVAAVGLSNLQPVNLNSSRNLFIIGFSIFFGLTLSEWMNGNPDVIDIGNENVNQIITILLSTGMFVSGFLGFFLDNTIPGTKEERGLVDWSHTPTKTESSDLITNRDTTYDIPFIMGFIKRVKLFKIMPISPTFSIGESLKLPKNASTSIFKRKKISATPTANITSTPDQND